MNFLSHYFFDGQANNPYFNLGLILPDLMGMMRRGWKIRSIHLTTDFTHKPDFHEMKKGVQQHLAMDDFFHKSIFFKENNQLIRNYLQTYGIHGKPYRPSFISHVFLEMLMDRILVKKQRHVVDHFYDELNRVGLSRLSEFYNDLGLPYYKDFYDFLTSFIENRYIYRYADTDKFFDIVNHIFKRVRQPKFDEWQIQQLRSSLDFLEDIIWHNFFELRNEIKYEK